MCSRSVWIGLLEFVMSKIEKRTIEISVREGGNKARVFAAEFATAYRKVFRKFWAKGARGRRLLVDGGAKDGASLMASPKPANDLLDRRDKPRICDRSTTL